MVYNKEKADVFASMAYFFRQGQVRLRRSLKTVPDQ